MGIISVTPETKIPLFGIDYLGILDRGTNVLEIKPITICNLRCKYCFVSAGDYTTNFKIDVQYLLDGIKKAIKIKNSHTIEIHIAPYGEFMLYDEIYELIRELRKIPEVAVISAQTNGLLLTEESVKKLEQAGMDRLNISLNSMDSELCAQYCGVKHYDLVHLLNIFECVLRSSMQLLIAPVWFMGKNDQGILDILDYAVKITEQGHMWPKFRLGIQNYLTYKTGRKFKKIRMREFKYFYKRLQDFEHHYNLKLKFGPKDFDISKTLAIHPPVSLGDHTNVEILMQGRYENEYIARVNEDFGIKILSKTPLHAGQIVNVKIIKSSLSGNLLTGIPE